MKFISFELPLTSESQLHNIFVTVKNQEIKLNYIYNPNYLFDNQRLFPYVMYVKLQLCIQDIILIISNGFLKMKKIV